MNSKNTSGFSATQLKNALGGRGAGGYHPLSVLLAHAEILEPRVLPFFFFFFPVSVDQIPQTGEEEKLIHVVNLTASV